MSTASIRRFNRTMIVIGSLLVLSLAATNVLVDPFAMFGVSTWPDGPASNERYRKIEHLAETSVQYEHLMFGSSRSGMTQPEWVEGHTGERTYNLSVFSAKPTDMRALYRAYRLQHEAPRSVTIGLDAMAFLSEPDEDDLSRRHHPSVDAAGWLGYWFDYLLAPSFIAIADKWAARKAQQIRFDWETGTYALVGKDAAILEDHEQYMVNTFSAWAARAFVSEFDQKQWDELTEWLEELAEDEVRTTVFVQPMHHQWRERMQPLMPIFNDRLTTLPAVVDLSDLGSEDDTLWYEQRHYRPVLARELIARLYRSGGPAVVATAHGKNSASP